MSKYNPAAPRTSGSNPKDSRVLAGKYKAKTETKFSRKAEELRFQKYCGEVFERNFGEEKVEGEVEAREIFENTVREIVADKAFRRIPSTRKILLLTGVAALFAASYLPETGAGFESYLTKIAGGAIGGALAGPVGAIAGAGIAAMPFVGAVESTPAPTVKLRSVKKAKAAEVKKEVMGHYDVDELTVKEGGIYVAAEGGDWLLSLRGFEPLSEFATHDSREELQFVPIKIRDLITTDFAGFKSVITEAKKRLEASFNAAAIMMLNSVYEIELKISDGTITSHDGLILPLSKKFSEVLGLDLDVVIKGVEKSLIDFKGKNIHLEGEKFHSQLKRNLRDAIFSRFEDEDALRIMFEKFKKDPKAHVAEADYREAVESVNKMQKECLLAESYTDRVDKAKIFASSARPTIILIHPKISDKVPFFGLTSGHQRGAIFFAPKASSSDHVKKRVYTHEILHFTDGEKCRVVDEEIKYLRVQQTKDGVAISREPCADDEKRYDGSLAKSIVSGFAQDMKRLKTILEPEEFSNVERRLKNTVDREHEIIPYVTDIFPPKFLLVNMPNIAVIRAQTILRNRPEAKLYAALLGCDVRTVKDLLARDPSILEKTYDGIPLNELARGISRYDELVDSKFKKDGEKNPYSYAKMSEFVQKKYLENKGKVEVIVEADGGVRGR